MFHLYLFQIPTHDQGYRGAVFTPFIPHRQTCVLFFPSSSSFRLWLDCESSQWQARRRGVWAYVLYKSACLCLFACVWMVRSAVCVIAAMEMMGVCVKMHWGRMRWGQKAQVTTVPVTNKTIKLNQWQHTYSPITSRQWFVVLQCFSTLFVSLNLTRYPPYWTPYRGVCRPSWWGRFKSRTGLGMASNAQPLWTSGSWRRWWLMRTSAVSCRPMAPSCTCSARTDSTKWALDTVALSGYVAHTAACHHFPQW